MTQDTDPFLLCLGPIAELCDSKRRLSLRLTIPLLDLSQIFREDLEAHQHFGLVDVLAIVAKAGKLVFQRYRLPGRGRYCDSKKCVANKICRVSGG